VCRANDDGTCKEGEVSIFSANCVSPDIASLFFCCSALQGITMFDANTGYIAGGDNGIGASIVKTTDGGNTWNTLAIHQPALLFNSIAAADEEHLIANGIGLVGFGGTQYTKGN
jgi:hypothetical protein